MLHLNLPLRHKEYFVCDFFLEIWKFNILYLDLWPFGINFSEEYEICVYFNITV
jgi:hypothetical protein